MKLKTEKVEGQEGVVKKEVTVVKPRSERGFFRKFFGFIGEIFRYLFLFLKHFLILIEKIIKLFALFFITIAGCLFLLVTSFYLFSSTFGLKESPAFQTIRDRIGLIYATRIEKEILEAEKEGHLEWKEELEALKKDIEQEEEMREVEAELESEKMEGLKEAEETLEDLEERIDASEKLLMEKEKELEQMEAKIKASEESRTDSGASDSPSSQTENQEDENSSA